MAGEVEWFQSTGNRVWGGLAVLGGLVVVVLAAVSGPDWAVLLGGLLFALLAYASFLRPKVGASERDLLLRAMYTTTVVPLAAIDSVAVSRTFGARVLDRTYVSSALGRSLRSVVVSKPDNRPGLFQRRPPAGTQKQRTSYADLVEGRLRQRIDDARVFDGAPHGSDRQVELADDVRREWAWPELALTLVVAIALVVAMAV